eukprot:902543_1
MGATCGCSPGSCSELKAERMNLLARRESLTTSEESVLYSQMISPLDIFPRLAKIKKQWTQCADCDNPNPEWAEISRGAFICIKCSGIHRNFGTNISKVRSITLDKWT